MSGDTMITVLTAPQADGLACVVCGIGYLWDRVPHVPVGRSMIGPQAFACVSCCPGDARRTAGGVLR